MLTAFTLEDFRSYRQATLPLSAVERNVASLTEFFVWYNTSSMYQ